MTNGLQEIVHAYGPIFDPFAPRVDLASGLRLTYEWYRRHVFDADAAAPTAV